ncbi:MAG: rhomboid family intramembrane serine protease [Paracoccaceae bacterium]
MESKTTKRRMHFVPMVSFLLATMTLIVSLWVSQKVNGTPLSTVRIVDLAEWGGVRYYELDIGNLWRVMTAQLVHVKWPHMLYNVVCLFAVGALIEKQIGRFWTLFVWGVIGGLATLISPIFVEAPYNVGTGASHAVLAFVGCAIILIARGRMKGALPTSIVAISLLPALGLDLFFAGHIKIGHAVALVGGIVFCVLFLMMRNKHTD